MVQFKKNIKWLSCLLVSIFIFSSFLTVVPLVKAQAADSQTVQQKLTELVQYYKINKTVLTNWEEVVGLHAAGQDLARDPWQLPDWKTAELNNDYPANSYSTIVLAMLAAGQDPTAVDGRNLLLELAAKQKPDGSFGDDITQTVWAIIALDKAHGNYNASAAVSWLLQQQLTGGGFAFIGDTIDADISAHVLIALSNYQDIADVVPVISSTKTGLNNLQMDTAGFSNGSEENTETTAAVIKGLISCGEDILNVKWQKHNITLIDSLFKTQLQNGSFAHAVGGDANFMSTRQALNAVSDLVIAGYPDYAVKTVALDEEEQPVTTFSIQLRVEALKETDSILNPYTVEVKNTDRVIDALKKGLDNAGIVNSIDTTSGMLNTGDINLNTNRDLSSFFWMYTINDDLNTGFNPLLNPGDKVAVYLCQYPLTAYSRLIINTNVYWVGEKLHVLVQKSDNGWPAQYIPAAGVPVYCGDITQFTDTNGQAELSLETPGSFRVYAEGYTDDGIAEVVKTAPQIIKVNTRSSGESVDSHQVTILVQGDNDKGIILSNTSWKWETERCSVIEVLKGVLDKKGIKYLLETDNSYVYSIDGLREKKSGYPNSGWKYRVNGYSPTVAANNYYLNDGDLVEWYFVLDYAREETGVPQIIIDPLKMEQEIKTEPKLSDKKINGYITKNLDNELRVSFADISPNLNWAQKAIEILAGNKIMVGTEKGFEPNRSTTRAEFMQLIMSVYGLETASPRLLEVFSDVNQEDWFAKAVNQAKEMKIISGYTDRYFRPHMSISRNEVAVILGLLQRSERPVDDELALGYVDHNNIPAWAREAVAFLHREGIMNGYKDNSFRGEGLLSRAEAAVLIYNYMTFNSKASIVE